MRVLGNAKRAWLTLAAAMVVGALPCLALAEDAQDLAVKIQQSRKGVVEAEAQKRRILGSLYVINQRMKKITSEKSHLMNELFQVQDNVKTIAKIIASLEVQIEKQRAHLRKRLRALYKLSGQSYVAVLFSRGSSAELDETLRFLKIVTDNDYLLIKNYQENVALYAAQRKKLRGQIEKLVGIEKNIKRQEGRLASEHKQKTKIVSELDRERTANIDRIKTIRSRTRDLASREAPGGLDFGDLLKPSIYEQKGQLSMPVQGTVVQDFGLIFDEKYKIRLSHKGWRVETDRGAPVSSIFDGTVVHSDHVPGHGHTVVIDHGDHYYTVYSHIARVRAKVGDTLKKGQSFAEAGAPVSEYGDGIYFEIRHFSEPENPSNWMLKREIQKQASIAQAGD